MTAVTIDEGWLRWLLGGAFVMIGGIIRNLIAQALMEKRLRDVELTIKRLPNALAGIDRRTLYMLQLMADMAKASGLDRRVPDDLLIRMLTDDEGAR